jgi:hypothetical protein
VNGKGIPLKMTIARVTTIGAVIMIPWTLYLLFELPDNYTGSNYRGTWIGFDVALILLFCLTAFSARAKKLRLELLCSATGTLLFADAWFDVMGSGTTDDLRVAIIMTLLFEIPVGVFFWLAAIKGKGKH